MSKDHRGFIYPPRGIRRILVVFALAAFLLLLFDARAVAAGSSITNGNFGSGLQGWTPVVVSGGAEAGYPHLEANGELHCFPAEVNKPFASIDAPDGASGYLQQRIAIPKSPPALRILTWGNLDPVTATISVVTADNVEHVLVRYTPPTLQATPSTCSGAKPITESLNVAQYAGQTVELRLAATSHGFDGTLVNFTDVTFGGQPLAPAANSQRSTIASALVPVDKAFPLTWRTLLDAIITLVAMLLITFPAQLFNRTLDENYDDIRSMARRRLPLLLWLRRHLRRQNAPSGRNSVVLVLVVGAVLGGLNDPTFGVSVKSFETLIAVLLACAAGMAVTGRTSWIYRRRRHLDAGWEYHSLPAGLLVATVCMVLSRITHFEPGYLYGVIAGLRFTTELGKREQGHDVALGSLAVLVMAVVAWVIWTPVGHLAAHPHAVAPVLIADTFLGGLFVSGVVGTVINLVPLEFLPGAVLARWHKVAWAAVFGVALFLLIEVMLLPAARSSRLGDAPFVTTIVLFVLFAAASIAFNRYFAVRKRQAHATNATSEPVPDEPGVGRGGPASTGGPEAQTEDESVLGNLPFRPGPGFTGPVSRQIPSPRGPTPAAATSG